MATLEFFCNRPTVVALIKFGIDVSESYPGETLNAAQSGEDNATQRSPVPRDIVKGLLGEARYGECPYFCKHGGWFSNCNACTRKVSVGSQGGWMICFK